MIKKDLSELACFGGTPAFERILHVGMPNIGDRQKLFERFNEVLDRRWLTNDGPFVQEFERRIASLIGVKHCIAMTNGTIALEIAIRALGLKGDVIVPSMTFIATAHALQWQGITPIFCDIDPVTGNLNPAQVLERMTPHTTGILGVHLWGRPADVVGLSEIAQRHHLPLLFDAAHAFGCTTKGRFIGNFGDAEVFSFHATKSINSLEGGAVVTNRDDLAEKMRLMRNFGFAGYDNVVYVGTNGKMNEMSAAMGLTSLESMDDIFSSNRSHYRTYQRVLSGIAGVELLGYDEKERTNYQYIVTLVDEVKTGISRDVLAELLWAENVRARRYFYPGCHRMEPYRSQGADISHLLPVTERLVDQCLVLPTGTSVPSEEIERIGELVHYFVAHSKEILPRLQALKMKKAGNG